MLRHRGTDAVEKPLPFGRAGKFPGNDKIFEMICGSRDLYRVLGLSNGSLAMLPNEGTDPLLLGVRKRWPAAPQGTKCGCRLGTIFSRLRSALCPHVDPSPNSRPGGKRREHLDGKNA